MSTLNEDTIMKIVRSSIWTGGNSEIHGSNGNGKLICKITDKKKREYVINVFHWKQHFYSIINEIVEFAKCDATVESEFKQKIDSIVHEMEVVDQEIIVNDLDSSFVPGSRAVLSGKLLVLKKGTILYRYTDDKVNHLYANPNPVTYGRFTDPSKKNTRTVIYLAYKKQVAKKEVKGSNSKQLVKYRVRKDIRLTITPGMLSATVVKCWKIPIRKCRFSNIFLR